ncbi:CHASE2 domain-containing protein [Pseudomonas oryzihabitans]|uniref:CHASE2 domain-containing protein n=1 Tax=Pseudomonas oryzihabitans TaxID=47885 RepID=UPI0028939BC3|nr:CHASE2 domain-containing protein [Pseudomonas oryzihabitans]MDT3720241.1 CHASE2 domain-containing protein [Pseudomonas oryzihabitans]
MNSVASVLRRRAPWMFALSLGLSLVFGVGALLDVAPLQHLNRLSYDQLSRFFTLDRDATRVQVVSIDEASLAALGQWPWPRYRVAELLSRVAEAQPAAIAVDILFSEPDRTSLKALQQTFQDDFGVQLSFSGVPADLQDNDGYLGHVMDQVGAVGARFFALDKSFSVTSGLRTGVGFEGALDALHLPEASGVLDSIPAIASQTRFSGFINSQRDSDGVVRRVPLLMSHQGIVHPSLALAATMRALGLTHGVIESGFVGPTLLLGSLRLPIDDQGQALLRLNADAERYPRSSALDVLSGALPDGALRGKIVLVGVSAAGFNDFHTTALGQVFSGARLQAALAQDLLDATLVRVPQFAGPLQLALCLLCGLLLSFGFFVNRSQGRFALLATILIVAPLLVGTWLFGAYGIFMPLAGPLLLVVVLSGLAMVTRIVVAQRHEQRWRKRLERSRQVTIESMAAVAETRDPETGAHIKRTQYYVRAIAEELRRTGQDPDLLTPEYIQLLFLSAPLHDIGKVGVPDAILLKPGRLTAEEMTVMQKHAEFGRQIILNTASHLEDDNFLALAADIAGTHHEKWDGTGYPNGLAGTDIPLSGRIMAVADIYDALISRRCYKEPFSHEHSLELMRGLRGSTFEPRILDAFLAIEPQILAIAKRFRDESSGTRRLL